MKIAIVQYNAGNTRSVQYALQRFGITPEITADPDRLRAADKVIFPGVGEASSAMKFLREHQLDLVIKELKQPVLGICLGMQLMCRHSEEGNVKGLGIFSNSVKRFPSQENSGFKVPHMGWNTLSSCQGRLFKGLPEAPFVYYVHSFYAEIGTSTVATTDYILPFSAALYKDNFYALQFHPEKSGVDGELIMRNFLELTI
ncbi:MAG: imidazole glycerol phosphate synthase subunit HisH [Bacteroidetes bacterium]|nr:imidazole glycerol phosphate synthase subunit HisH [Bacteroidota bacterium]